MPYVAQKMRARKTITNWTIQILAVICFIILMGVGSFSAIDSLQRKQDEQNSQSLACLVQFKEKECNPFSLSPDCTNILKCAQMESTPSLVKLFTFGQVLIDKMSSIGVLPACLIGLLLLFSIKSK